ncbi:3-dehydroquinate dehydratase (3-dehydroquinase) [Taxawa tesnikishii (nom. ined.)]|nr:3-dehydroquinate dehydratase (3-dehydroquinase) [Dothideales sp. JES 119]
MATLVQLDGPTPASLKSNGTVTVEFAVGEEPSLLVIYDEGQDQIVAEIANVLGQQWYLGTDVDAAARAEGTVFGLVNTSDAAQLHRSCESRTVLSTHCLDDSNASIGAQSPACDYEYLYTTKPFYKRDLARFLSFVLGQINPHKDLAKKAKTTLISTTFPDVRVALPNLDILSVGADAIELRVDLLEEPRGDGTFNSVPSLNYVGEQLMILRQRTELPIIFTTRCTKENGRFPMDDPSLFYEYLHRAIQWGCEYIDVELWLPEEIRRKLSQQKGNSKIISAFHDFSGNFKWTSPDAQRLFNDGAVYGDVVKMIALVSTMQENYELEYFRSIIQSTRPHPPFSGLNMGPAGQLSRALNKVFTPITHPLLPLIAAPGQLSAAEINSALHSMGQMPKLDIYAIGSVRSTGQAMFFEKCFNELSLPHQLLCIERSPRGSIESILAQRNFGGAYINPPLAASASYLPALTDAAASIGQVDTVVVRPEGSTSTFLGDNATWKGIRATLCRDFVPSAYSGQAALLLASAESQAAAAIFALRSLNISPIYTIGFKAHGALANYTIPFKGLEDVKAVEQPSTIISALPAAKSLLVAPLLKHYSGNKTNSEHRRPNKVFVDLAYGPRKGDPVAIATSLGWTAYGIAEVNAWTTVETLRLLVGQNVPYDFVRLASGRSLY